VPRPRRRNPWTSTGEVLLWLLFAALLFPAGFAGWAVGHYTSLGKPAATVVRTVTVGSTAAATTAPPTSTAAPTTAATTVVRTVTVGSTAAATTAPPTSTAAPTTAATTTTAPSGGNAAAVAAGKAVFLSSGCGACHTFKPANATGTIGPDLDTAPAQSAKADHNMPLPAFIKQSIVDPNAYIAQGYSKGIMPTTFGTQLSAKQIDDLVAFILSGTKTS